jgi:hypothetical protein
MTGLSETAIRGASRTMVRRQERDDRAGAGLTAAKDARLAPAPRPRREKPSS